MAPAPDRARQGGARGAGGGREELGARLWGRETVVMFCEIASILDGHAEAGACPRHKTTRRGAPLSSGTFRACLTGTEAPAA